MQFDVSGGPDNAYVVVTLVGDITRASSIATIAEGNALANEIGTRCWLIDVTRARFVDRALDQYKLAHIDAPALPDTDRRACIAVVAAPSDHSHDLYVAMAKTAGFDMTLFYDRDEAIAHLAEAAERFKRQPDA